MRNTVLIAILVIISLHSLGKNPPGTVEINENLYCDAAEVTNIGWREYMHWNKKIYGEESDQYKSTIPDTAVWLHRNIPYATYYLKHAAFGTFPVVGISYDQAVSYCKWRSDRVNESIYIEENKIDYKAGDVFPDAPKIYKYRLLTRDEWETVAQADYSKKGQRKFSRKKYRNKEKYNFYTKPVNREKGVIKSNDLDYYTRNVNNYFPNTFGVYDMLGNVAEMIAQKGIAKGGSWTHKADKVSVEKDFEYSKPTKWLGFRCVCERVDKKK